MPTFRSRHRGALLGLAAGDAVGTSVEFSPRGSFPPVTDMEGGGPFGLQPGMWTDDTSMALCLGRSLLDCAGFDAGDQIRRYVRWRDGGYLSSTGHCFDIGNTVSAALARFEQTGDPLAGSEDPRSAGNGSLMRLVPVALYYAAEPEEAVRQAAASSRTTHGTAEAVDACRLYAAVLVRALAGQEKDEVLAPATGLASPVAPSIAALAAGAWRGKKESEIRGSGYVVHALEAALWCFAETSSFREAILRAVNLGEDTDTTAAITGQLAGAYYGEEEIPAEWRAKLARGDEIARLAEALGRARSAAPPPLARTYWASPGAVLAGAYPGHLDEEQGIAHVRALLEAGVRRFLNLMEAREVDRQGRVFEPYEHVVEREAKRLGVKAECRRFPIVDMSVPSADTMDEIQAWIDESVDAALPIYVHCWGGRGRTGTAVGIHLVRHGQAEPDDFVDVIAHRRGADASRGASPENARQVAFVRSFLAPGGR
ncbi:MAG: ADP-ribosylglycohydrolase family protein [Myxococcota bacterium]